jgi:ABC-type branched-subunit amino acid transport system substrate-binding protein
MLAFLTILATPVACSGAAEPTPQSSPVVELPEPSSSREDGDAGVLARAEEAWLAEQFGEATRLTDSLDEAWQSRPGIPDNLTRRLVTLLLARAEDDRAVHQLLYHPGTLNGEWRQALSAAVSQMSLEELDRQARRVSSDSRGLQTVSDERDRLLALADTEGAIRLGVIVPQTGGFASVGREVLEGIRLAAAQFEAAIRSGALRAAAAARSDPGTLIISPTAAEDALLPPHAYSIWARARRDQAVAEALGNWLVGSMEPARVAAFYPENASGFRRVDIFRELVVRAGFEWVGSRGYDPDSTTFEMEIQEITEADPDFVFVVADGPRQVLQVAPQLHFYGLRGRVGLVSEDWAHPMVGRRLDPTFSDYRVSAVYSQRVDNAEWDAFAAAWDEAYRRSIPDNAFAPLGYDATLLALVGISNPPVARRRAVARAATRLTGFQGATGVFRFDPTVGRLVRSTSVRMLLGSQLVDPDAEAIAEWSLEARTQEEERLRLEAEEELRRQSIDGD